MTVNLFSNIMNDNDDFNFLLNQVGENVYIEGNEHKAIITNTKLNVYVNHDDRYISTNFKIQRGNLVEWGDKKWLVYSDVEEPRHHRYKAIMRPTNYNINFNIGCVVHSIPCIVETQYFDTTSNKYMILPVGTIFVTLQENDTTKQITINSRFIKNEQAFKVKGIDFSQKGLLKLYCEKDLINHNDDLENEIANVCNNDNGDDDDNNEPAPEPEPTGTTIEILGANEIRQNVTETYTIEIKQDGEIVSNNVAEWTLSNDNAVFVNGNTGTSIQIKGSKIGAFTLTAKWIEDNSIEVTRELRVRSGW